MKLIIDCKEENLEPEIIALAINLALNAGCAEQLCDYKHGKGLKLLFKRAYKNKDSLVMKMIRNISSHSSPDIKNQFIVRIKSSVTYSEIWRCEQISLRRYCISRGERGISFRRCGCFSLEMYHL
jgi:hypothetical protein